MKLCPGNRGGAAGYDGGGDGHGDEADPAQHRCPLGNSPNLPKYHSPDSIPGLVSKIRQKRIVHRRKNVDEADPAQHRGPLGNSNWGINPTVWGLSFTV